MSKFYKIVIDDKIFNISDGTIKKYPSSLLYRVIKSGEQTDYIYFDHNTKTVLIDRDPFSFSYIVDLMRGYELTHSDIPTGYLSNKIIEDLEFYGLEFPTIKKLETIKLEIPSIESIIAPTWTHNLPSSQFDDANDESKFNDNIKMMANMVANISNNVDLQKIIFEQNLQKSGDNSEIDSLEFDGDDTEPHTTLPTDSKSEVDQLTKSDMTKTDDTHALQSIPPLTSTPQKNPSSSKVKYVKIV